MRYALGEPKLHDIEYSDYIMRYPDELCGPWKSFDPSLQTLVLGLLDYREKSRFTIDLINSNQWFNQESVFSEQGVCTNSTSLAERFILNLELAGELIARPRYLFFLFY